MSTTTIFESPTALGAKILTVSTTITNTSGSYTSTVQDERLTTAMKAIKLELGNPAAFDATINVAVNNGSLTITCASVSGTSTAVMSVLKVCDDPTAVTSTEFDVLENRMGDLDDLTTTAKTDLVSAVNETKGATVTNSQAISNLNNKFFTQISSGTNLNNITTTGFYGVLNGTIAASLVNTPITSGGFVLEVLNKGGTVVQTAKTGDQLFTRGQYSGGFDSWHEFATKGNLSSETGGVPVRKAGVIQNNKSFTVHLSNTFSSNEGFALVSIAVSGASIAGWQMLLLGRGTGKIFPLISGGIATSGYSASYDGSSDWTITNKFGSDLYYTIIVSKT